MTDINDDNIDQLLEQIEAKLADLGHPVDPEGGAVMYERDRNGSYRVSIQAELMTLLLNAA